MLLCCPSPGSCSGRFKAFSTRDHFPSLLAFCWTRRKEYVSYWAGVECNYYGTSVPSIANVTLRADSISESDTAISSDDEPFLALMEYHYHAHARHVRFCTQLDVQLLCCASVICLPFHVLTRADFEKGCHVDIIVIINDTAMVETVVVGSTVNPKLLSCCGHIVISKLTATCKDELTCSLLSNDHPSKKTEGSNISKRLARTMWDTHFV